MTAPTRTRVTLAGEEFPVERISGRKASRAFAIIRAVSAAVPELVKEWGEFKTDYGERNVLELDRAQAMARYGPTPVIDPDTGEPRTYPADHPKAGEVIMVPGALDTMTETAWEAVDHRVRLPRSPTLGESVAAIFPTALDVAEEHVYRLLALFTMTNGEVKAAMRGDWPEALDERVDLIMDADLDELLELAVVAGEVVEEQFTTKVSELGDRLGNALRLLGINQARQARETPAEAPQTTSSEETSTPATSEDSPSSSTPTSSTDGLESTDGPPTPSSTPPSSSSPPLAAVASASESG